MPHQKTKRTFTLPIFPSISGSGPLLPKGYQDAHEAFREFKKKWNSIEFHGRDYNHNVPDTDNHSYRKAVKDREDLSQFMQLMEQYLDAHVEHTAE